MKHIYNQSQQLCECDNSEWDNWSWLERIGAIAVALMGTGLMIGIAFVLVAMFGN